MDNKVLIGYSDGNEVYIDVQEIVTGRTCVIAQSGAGKSYLLSVLCEKLLESKAPFCIVDTEGEYCSLKEKYKIVWIGKENADIDIDKVDLYKLAYKIIKESIPIILDVSDVMNEREIIKEFSAALYQAATEIRQPYLYIIEEADKFVPQSKDSLKEIEEIARRGRKRGLGIIIATQRPAIVNKNVLSQCGNQFIGKLTTENDLQAVNLFFGSRKELEDIPELEPGDFFMMGNISRKKIKMRSVPRKTKHVGATPKLKTKSLGKLSFKDILKKEYEEEKKIKIDEDVQKKHKVKFIKPKITKKKIIEIAYSKRKRKFILFGRKESVENITLKLYPLIFIQLKYPEKKLLKKEVKIYSFIIDSKSPAIVDIEHGLKKKYSFEKIMGLNNYEIKTLLRILRTEGINAKQIASDTKLSSKNIRSALLKLEKKNLITSFKQGRNKFYSAITNFVMPNFKKHVKYPAYEDTVAGDLEEILVKEKDIRNLFKSINPNSEIIKHEIFYYPIWSIYFEDRIINIDGISGKEI